MISRMVDVPVWCEKKGGGRKLKLEDQLLGMLSDRHWWRALFWYQ